MEFVTGPSLLTMVHSVQETLDFVVTQVISDEIYFTTVFSLNPTLFVLEKEGKVAPGKP